MRKRTREYGERGSALIVVLMVTMLLMLLGVGLLATSETELLIAANDHWSEGAFQAAEAAVQLAVDQLDVGNADDVIEVTPLGDAFAFRSGGRDDDEPQPPEMVGTAPAPGYAVTEGTGYNPSGYVFAMYRVQGTGIGPRNTEREVEVQVQVGPVAF
jgi:Tfp pilus assembly protein PilX